jgi:Ca2+-binding EF-hand superfamily protein
MFRISLTLSVLALVWAGGQITLDAQREAPPAKVRFQAMDVNRDGIIQRNEWQGSARSFDVHDWNGDGRLSGDEVRIGAQRAAKWEESDHMPNRAERYVSWTAAGFNNLDHNRDRRITPNEWHYDVETFRRVDRNRDGALNQAEFVGGDMDDDRGDNFDDLDFNNNGRVERNEWHGTPDAFTWLDTNRDGVLSRFEVAGGQETTGDTWDQFANLDYDRNGSIARNEWHWSLGSFDKRDVNRDGNLTRREFDATAGAATPGAVGSSGGSQTVRVVAQQRWTDTRLDVRAGDTISFSASGTIHMSDGANDAATPAGSTSGRRAPDSPIVNQPAGALLARLGDYGVIFIGDRRSIVAPVSGRLYLGVNDDHLADNRGEFNVTVGLQPRVR